MSVASVKQVKNVILKLLCQVKFDRAAVIPHNCTGLGNHIMVANSCQSSLHFNRLEKCLSN